jgi:hypothetical protein
MVQYYNLVKSETKMLQYRSIETFAHAKAWEMERLRTDSYRNRNNPASKSPLPKNKFELFVRVVIQPKFSVAITYERCLG